MLKCSSFTGTSLKLFLLLDPAHPHYMYLVYFQDRCCNINKKLKSLLQGESLSLDGMLVYHS
jgi:hypothetical protein